MKSEYVQTRIILFFLKYIHNGLNILWLMLESVLSPRGRDRIYYLAKYFGFEHPKYLLPKVDINQVVNDKISVQIDAPVGVLGNVSLLELLIISNLIKQHNPMTLLEIGTFDGRTALNMAVNTNPAARIFTLDLPEVKLEGGKLHLNPIEKDYVSFDKRRYIGSKYEDKITQLLGDSATFNFSPYRNTIDFIFIDGSHSYEYVRNDTEKAFDLLRNNRGVIVWHDYGSWEGVTRALNEFYSGGGCYLGFKHINGTSLAYLIMGA